EFLALPGSTVAESASVTGGSVIGVGCEVAENAVVAGSVLLDGARVGSGAVVRDSIVGRDAVIGKDSVLGEAVIGDGAVVGAGVPLRRRPVLVGQPDAARPRHHRAAADGRRVGCRELGAGWAVAAGRGAGAGRRGRRLVGAGSVRAPAAARHPASAARRPAYQDPA